MANGQSSVGTDRSGNKAVSLNNLEELRVRAVSRRRIARRQTARWIGNRSRREKMRTLAVCVGMLLLMAVGLYFGLSDHESARPVESAAPIGAVLVV